MIIAIISVSMAAPIEVHNPKRPLAIGVRAGAYGGGYDGPIIGGQLKIRATRGFGISGFWDNAATLRDGIVKHDHIIGFSTYFPRLLGGKRFFLSPTLGSCVDFRGVNPLRGRLPGNSDILFGVHAGGMFEVALLSWLNLEATATGTAYFGNSIESDGWTVGSSNQLHMSTTVQALVGLNLVL